MLSSQTQRLFASIFVDAKNRPKLEDLKQSQFSLSCEEVSSHFIDFQKERIVVEEEVVDILSKNYKVNADKVAESVISCKLDKFHALYYLTIKNERQTCGRLKKSKNGGKTGERIVRPHLKLNFDSNKNKNNQTIILVQICF